MSDQVGGRVASPCSNTGVQNTGSGRGVFECIIPPEYTVTRVSDMPVSADKSPGESGVRIDWLSFTLSAALMRDFVSDIVDDDFVIPDDELARMIGMPDVMRTFFEHVGLPVREWRDVGHGAQGYRRVVVLDGIDGARVMFGRCCDCAMWPRPIRPKRALFMA